MMDYGSIPPELQPKRFINWYLDGSNKIPSKPPYFDKKYPDFLKSNHSLDECIDHCEHNPKLGLGLLTGGGIGCIDLDNCTKNFSIHSKAQSLIENQNSFTEYSYSALHSQDGIGGVHVIGEIDKRFESLSKTYEGFDWFNEGKIHLLGEGKFVALTAVDINPSERTFDKLNLDYDFLRQNEAVTDPDLLNEVRTFKLESKHLVDIENRLSSQKSNGTKYTQIMAGVYEKFHRYRPSAVNDLAQAICYYSTSDKFWEKRGVNEDNKKLLALSAVDSVLKRSNLNWMGCSDEKKIACLERAYNYFTVDGNPNYGIITPAYSERQKIISSANNNLEIKADSDSRIQHAINDIGLGNKRAVARQANVSSRTLYRYLNEQ